MIPIKERCSFQLKEFDEKKDRLGKCYFYAYKAVEKMKNAILVHGYITDPIHGRIIDHAWAETGNKVYDPTLDTNYQKNIYYKLFKPEVAATYTEDEMYKKAGETGVYGPWHKIPAGKVRWWRV